VIGDGRRYGGGGGSVVILPRREEGREGRVLLLSDSLFPPFILY
jgi:hypothetical protein